MSGISGDTEQYGFIPSIPSTQPDTPAGQIRPIQSGTPIPTHPLASTAPVITKTSPDESDEAQSEAGSQLLSDIRRIHFADLDSSNLLAHGAWSIKLPDGKFALAWSYEGRESPCLVTLTEFEYDKIRLLRENVTATVFGLYSDRLLTRIVVRTFGENMETRWCCVNFEKADQDGLIGMEFDFFTGSPDQLLIKIDFPARATVWHLDCRTGFLTQCFQR